MTSGLQCHLPVFVGILFCDVVYEMHKSVVMDASVNLHREKKLMVPLYKAIVRPHL